MSTVFSSEVAGPPWLRAFLEKLSAREIPHALLARRAPAQDDERVRILVTPEDRPEVEKLARAEHLSWQETAAGYGSSDAAGAIAGVLPVTRLLYGGTGTWLATGECEGAVLRRAVRTDGVNVLAPADELIDLLLHCTLDLGELAEPDRRRLSELMAELRRDPPSAGRAAERTQRELAPAITWAELLDDVVHERWDAILARRGRLRLHLVARGPLGAVQRLASRAIGRFSRVGADTPEDRMPPPPSAAEERAEDAARKTRAAPTTEGLNRKQIRGSGLLLAGRGLSTGLKFFAELLVVRYLTTAAYGSWTWALSAVILLESFSTLGLNRAVPRFLPIHLERRERDELFGVAALVLGGLIVAGLAVVIAFYAFPTWVAGLAGASPGQSLDILFIVIFLVPVEGVGSFFTNVCAAFGNSRAIFVRRYVLHPGLLLTVSVVLVLLEANVRLLAYGYLISTLIGVAYYSITVYGELRRQGLLSGPIDLRMRLPVRRVFEYTLPVMGSDWFRTLMKTPAPLLLGYFSDMSAVALFQVVIPLVGLNTQASQSFTMLFEPSASRVLARNDRKGLEDLYWRSAVWVAILSFPGFALSFAAAEPLTVMLYGERYAAAAPILSVLALGTFIDVSAGFNDATLRVAGKIRWLISVNALGAFLNIGLNLLLIPRMGALGAGIATGGALLTYAILKQLCLWRATGVRFLHPGYARPYAVMALLTVGLVILRVLWPSQPWVLIPAVGLAVLIIALLARATLSISDTFPELARFPILKRILG